MPFLKNKEHHLAQFPMTLDGKKSLEQELDSLIKVDREAIKKAISEARELGDLKENSEYHAAKEKQSLLEGRIGEIQNKLAHAQAIDITKIRSSRIVFGAIITLYDRQKDQLMTVQIVGEDEAIGSHEKISYSSPLGKSLIGREQGDEVVVKAPKGDIFYDVENFHFPEA
jgi:transcription elongation factor GreA